MVGGVWRYSPWQPIQTLKRHWKLMKPLGAGVPWGILTDSASYFHNQYLNTLFELSGIEAHGSSSRLIGAECAVNSVVETVRAYQSNNLGPPGQWP